jgi:uncharacterized protein YycO
MTVIKLHFTQRNTLLSWLARIMTASKYAHCEVEIDGICYGARAFKGVYKQPVRELFENEDVIETWTVSADIEQEIQLQAWLDKQLGKKYDYLPALALGFLRQNWMNNDDKWFCSELIDAAFKQAGIPLTNQDYMPYRLTPNDLRPSNRLRYLSLEKSTSKPFWQKLVRFFV